MKKTSILLSLMTVGVMSFAQTTRLSLYEEFTGENCPPCASTNPGLQVILDNPTNLAKTTSIKWEVPIPSAPSATWSLYQTNKTEIDWRYRSTASAGYGYPSQNTPTSSIVSGINSAPSGRIDGQHQWTFGAASDHPANLNATAISNGQAVTSPFNVTLTRAWNAGYTAVDMTVSITAAQTFTCAGPLVFRLVMVEQEIHYATAPGSNGEKDFYNPARRSFPNLQTGTSMATSWTTGQNQTFTISCALPPNIVDKSMVKMIGFIQDDATRRVHQASRTATVGIPNDASAASIAGNFMTCGTSYSPVITVKNNGSNPITTMTITPTLDATPGGPYNWSGSLAAGATATINMPVLAPTNGSHTYSVNITGVNGAADSNPANNTKLAPFAFVSSYIAAPIVEPFTAVTFPPTNWFMYNPNSSTATWSRVSNVGAYAVAPLGASRYEFYNAAAGDKDELFLPPANFTGMSNMKLTFDVAYCQYSNELDKLDVMVSTNCGATWATVYSKSGTTLSTAPPQTAAFLPSSTQWRSEVVNLGAYDGMGQVIVKMVATSAYGNNMFVDNVNLVSTTGVKSVSNESTTVELYPNPAQNETNVRISTSDSKEVTITMLNSIGQQVNQKTVVLESGSNMITFDTKTLASGLYNVVISDKDGNSIVKKLTINK